MNKDYVQRDSERRETKKRAGGEGEETFVLRRTGYGHHHAWHASHEKFHGDPATADTGLRPCHEARNTEATEEITIIIIRARTRLPGRTPLGEGIMEPVRLGCRDVRQPRKPCHEVFCLVGSVRSSIKYDLPLQQHQLALARPCLLLWTASQLRKRAIGSLTDAIKPLFERATSPRNRAPDEHFEHRQFCCSICSFCTTCICIE